MLNGKPSTRPASFSACFALIVPYVTICATRSSPYFCGDVLDDLAAAPVVEVDVEVGHRDAVGVEEPLEDESVLQRVEVGDAHRVGGHRPGAGATAGTDADAVVLGPVDEVGDDEEVAGEAHLHDDVGLVLGLLAHLVGDAGGVAHVQAALDLLDEPALLGLAGGHRDSAACSSRSCRTRSSPRSAISERVVARLGVVAEDVPHLRRGLEVELVAVELEALGVVERRARLHAQQRRVALGVVLVRVVQVVRGDEREVELLREAQQVVHHAALDVEAVVHDLGEEVLLAEDVAELGGGGLRRVVLAESQAGLHFAADAAGRGDDALRVGLQQLTVDAGLEVVALERRVRRHPEEVVHARVALGEQRHVGVRARARDVVVVLVGTPPAHARLVGAMRAGGDVGLDADDRLDPDLVGRLVELERAERVAVVGDGDRRHPLLRRLFDQRLDARSPVEHRVFAVHVQVNEGVGCHESRLPGGADPGSPASRVEAIGRAEPVA